MDGINASESAQKQPILTHLVRILEAGTAASEHVPTGSASTALTLNKTSVQEGQEQAIDHFRFDLTVPLPGQA